MMHSNAITGFTTVGQALDRTIRACLVVAMLAVSACALTRPAAPPIQQAWATPQLQSLADLSVAALRARSYGSELQYLQAFAGTEQAAGSALLASYQSDGLRLYTRLDLPAAPPPDGGYPVVIYVHGWVGKADAPGWDFARQAGSYSAMAIHTYRAAGFAVLTPGLRGHGRVAGVAADGLEFLDAWDNGSYLSPMFYTIDVLNLLDSIDSLNTERWQRLAGTPADQPLVNLSRLHLAGHSQGGDAVLTALAVAGEGSQLRHEIASASITAGCFAHRFTQLETYGPMGSTLQAFMAGDGRWTGSAVGRDGRVNPNFVFPYPSDWIQSVDPSSPEWTWQKEVWSVATVRDAVDTKLKEMYAAINRQVNDINDASYRIDTLPDGRLKVRHDQRIESAMDRIGGFAAERFITEPLNLHYSDRDYYSLPTWNESLAKRIQQAGGRAYPYAYRGTNHSIKASKYAWFSPPGTQDGQALLIERDVELFMESESR